MSSNKTTFANENEKDQDFDCTFIIEELLYVVGATIAISSIVILNTVLEKLHCIMKTILTILCSHNAIVYITLTVISAVWHNYRNLISCSMTNVLKKSTALITFEHSALISFVRHHLAHKTANNENPNVLLIIAATASVYVFEYTASSVLILLTTTNYEASCLKEEHSKENSMISICQQFFVIALTCGVTSICDYKLVRFLRNRNKLSRVGPNETKVVPWKTQHDELTYDIPIMASLTSLLAGTILISILILVIDVPEYIVFSIIVVAFPSIVLMTILGLTYKVSKLKKPLPSVPRKLHFHEDKVEEADEEDESSHEVQDQGLVHRGHLELDHIRAEVKSMAGDIASERLERVNERLSFHKGERHEITFVRPFSCNTTNSEVLDDVKDEGQKLPRKTIQVQVHVNGIQVVDESIDQERNAVIPNIRPPNEVVTDEIILNPTNIEG